MTRPDHLPDTANKNPEGWGAVPGFQSKVSPKHIASPRRTQPGGDPTARHIGDALRLMREAALCRQVGTRNSPGHYAITVRAVALAWASEWPLGKGESIRSAANWLLDAHTLLRDGDVNAARLATIRALVAMEWRPL